MIAKSLAKRLLGQQSLYNFAKASTGTQTGETTTLKRGQISQVKSV